MKKMGYYQYQVFYRYESSYEQGYVYELYTLNEIPRLTRECDEWFDTEAQAEFAAIGHISLLENGEG